MPPIIWICVGDGSNNFFFFSTLTCPITSKQNLKITPDYIWTCFLFQYFEWGISGLWSCTRQVSSIQEGPQAGCMFPHLQTITRKVELHLSQKMRSVNWYRLQVCNCKSFWRASWLGDHSIIGTKCITSLQPITTGHLKWSWTIGPALAFWPSYSQSTAEVEIMPKQNHQPKNEN